MSVKSKSLLSIRESVSANKALIVAFVSLTMILLLPMTFNLLPTKQESVKMIERQVRNEGVKVLNGQALCQAVNDGGEIVFKISGNLTELYNYQNLFQTSDLNTGIRFEIDGLGHGGLIIGSSAADGYSGLSIPNKFVVGNFVISIRIKSSSQGRSAINCNCFLYKATLHSKLVR